MKLVSVENRIWSQVMNRVYDRVQNQVEDLTINRVWCRVGSPVLNHIREQQHFILSQKPNR